MKRRRVERREGSRGPKWGRERGRERDWRYAREKEGAFHTRAERGNQGKNESSTCDRRRERERKTERICDIPQTIQVRTERDGRRETVGNTSGE